MTLTPAQQRNAVSEGSALGLIMFGVETLPWDKLRVDLAFEDAWESWPHRHLFPQVSRDLNNGSGVQRS